MLAAAVLVGAALVGPDASWDLRNYHLYNGYAVLHGRVGVDLVPAQMQTFNAPTLDVIYNLLLHACNGTPRFLNALLALPYAIAAVLVLLLARRQLPPLQAFTAALIGITGAAALPTLATTMNVMLPAACVLGAVLLLLGRADAPPSEPACLGAGLLGGAAVGLHLTTAPYVLGLMMILPVSAGCGRRGRSLAWLIVGGALGAGLFGGLWWWTLWQRFGNPVFPYFNNVFRSPWAEPVRIADLRFMPRSVMQALFYPLFWAWEPQTLVTELPSCDPRIALGWMAALVIAVRKAYQRGYPRGRQQPETDRAAAMLPAFWAMSFVGWEVCFSILRYLAVLELLSGVLIMMALRPVLARLSSEWQRTCSVAVVIVLLGLTTYPDWGRATGGQRAVAVTLPAIPGGSLVVLLDPSPMSYVAAFAAGDLRFVGANNNLIHLGDRNRLAEQIATAIRTQPGPLWGLEMPRESPGAADATLHAYGLRRAPGCVAVRSNLDNDGIVACPLERIRGE